MDGVEREEDKKRITLLTDSHFATALAENPDYYGRSKHIQTKWHFVRERVQSGQIKLQDVRTKSMASDMLTKSMGPVVLATNMKLMGMNVESGLSELIGKGRAYRNRREHIPSSPLSYMCTAGMACIHITPDM